MPTRHFDGHSNTVTRPQLTKTISSLKHLGARMLCGAVLTQVVGGTGLTANAQPGSAPTVSGISASGTQTYQLTCTVTGPPLSGITGPSGNVTFTDATAGQTLGTAPLSVVVTGTSHFENPLLYPAGNLPISIAAGDFNGDGKLDLAFGGADGSISLLLGNGDGSFQAPATILTPALISFTMTSGDFNGDGNLDLALSDWDTGDVYVLLGNGDGTFQAPKDYPNSAGTYGGEMIAADVNGDHKLDLVITDFNNDKLSVLLGNGDGTFQPAIVTQTDSFPGGVAAADLNGDGKMDLVVASDLAVSIFPGNGDGTFGTPTDYPVLLGASVEGIALADFNGDKNVDIAVTSLGGTYVLLGNGDGTFETASLVYADYPGSYIATGDFIGDGHIDMVISGYEAGAAEVLQGNGDGTFQWYQSLSSGGETPGPSAAINLPGYPLPNLVIGNNGSGNASVFLNNGDIAAGTLSGVVLSTQPPPSHNVECSYPGDSNYAASTSNPIALIAEPAASPQFTPPSGTYVGNGVSVTISDSTNGATTYYTTDGSTPTANSNQYSAPIPVTTGETLEAIAYASGYFPSSVVSATYTLQTATPVITPGGGTFESVQNVTITDATSGAAIYYTTDGSAPTTSSSRYTAPIHVAAGETLNAIAYATGFLPSSVASATFTLQATNPVLSPAGGMYHSTQTVTITDATAGASIYYTTDGSTPTENSTRYVTPIQVTTGETVKAVAYLAGFLPSGVVSAAYTLQAAMPLVKPAGGTYQSAQTVTITESTGASTVYYTTDGSTPTSNSTRYTAPISVTSSETIKAIAMTSGFLNSEVATATYQIVIPSFALSASPTAANVAAGTSAAFSVSVTPSGGFSKAVTFSCSGLPAESQCAFKPASVTPTTGTASTTLSISTTAPLRAQNREPGHPGKPWRTGGMVALAGVFGILFLRRRNGLRALCLALALTGAGLLPLCGCSSVSSGSGSLGTPEGTYTITVSAQPSGGAAETLHLTLVVE